MQLMAQHKYGIQVKSSWKDYFEKLGKSLSDNGIVTKKVSQDDKNHSE
jgi:hypothetical protein